MLVEREWASPHGWWCIDRICPPGAQLLNTSSTFYIKRILKWRELVEHDESPGESRSSSWTNRFQEGLLQQWQVVNKDLDMATWQDFVAIDCHLRWHGLSSLLPPGHLVMAKLRFRKAWMIILPQSSGPLNVSLIFLSGVKLYLETCTFCK